ncbi:transglycosylase domain-containing protein [Microlunatus speluncae]|uniref:transglycosylase domain-containing protein n=1 Tax=Microlunatus speluncae TaxID=2594267 RepID=UPI0012666BEC|nr:transglycosylase domain-containing protein [Microlunatus speluncae]
MPVTPKRVVKVVSAFAMFAVVSVLAGVLVAGLFVPLAGLSGATGQAAAGELDNLPAELDTPPQAERSTVLLGNGDVLTYFYDQNRIYTKLDKIAPVMVQAQLAIEDHRFYQHGALDLTGTMRALLQNSSGGSTQGGSSISQQYVKMVLLDACDLDQACIAEVLESSGLEGYQRKIRELRYAIALEEKFSKDEILERYLNIAYFGDGAYGVEAAARHYFNTTAAKLTLPQAAMLAGLVRDPNQVNPVKNPGAAIDRRDVVINRMAELNLITPDQAKQAKATGFDQDKVQRTRNGCVDSPYPFICDYVRRTLLQLPSLGNTPEEREHTLNRGGLTIETAIDPKTQKVAQRQLSKVVGPKDSVIATMNMIQPGTGLILAMAQSRPEMGDNTKKGETYYNYSATPEMGGAEGFQAGSTFKAFTAAAALEQGIPFSKKYDAKSRMDFTGRTFDSCEGRVKTGKFPVKNSTQAEGVMDMRRAAEQSTNTYFVQLALDVGMCDIVELTEKLGMESSTKELPISAYDTMPSFTLGTAEIAPMKLAEAYATFAARGVHCDPIVLEKVTTSAGKQLKVPDGNCRRVIPTEVADGMNELLSGVINNGTGRPARLEDGRPQAGKTGTTDDNYTVSFAGYTPDAAGVAMIAIDNRKVPFRKGKEPYRSKGVLGYETDTGVRLEGSGGGDAGSLIWKPTMERYLKDLPESDFTKPPREIETGALVDLPAIGGLSIDDAIAKLEEAGFTVRRTRRPSETVPEGELIGFSQTGGQAPAFSTIELYVSSGPEPPEVPEPSEGPEEPEPR